MAKIIEVYQPGLGVEIGEGVKARIAQVAISETGLQYEVVWWSGDTRQSAWVAPSEINAPPVEKKKISFIRGGEHGQQNEESS